jgi:division protein CdvB (Snf7/Vps24/ESCRT-III family)
VTGQMQKSTEVMKMMGKLCKVSEISATMQELQKEMVKVRRPRRRCRRPLRCATRSEQRGAWRCVQAGVIEEMVDDAMEALDGDEDEDAADEEVERVMTELNAETTSKMSAAPTRQPVAAAGQAEAAAEEDEEDEEDMAAMRERLAQIRG